MRKAVRAIIISNERLLVMHRNKFGSEYDTLPGGNIEMGEAPEHALIREVGEESMVQFGNPRLVFIEHAGAPAGDQYVYLCDYISGEPTLAPNSEEAKISAMGKNLYEPKWLPLKNLASIVFLSETLKQYILASIDQGWPAAAVEITTK